MRFLKSLLTLGGSLLLLSVSAQDTTIISDTEFLKPADTLVAFPAEKNSTPPVWREQAIPDSALRSLRQDDAFWYANAHFDKKKQEPKRSLSFGNIFGQPWFRNLMWALIVTSFIVVIILFLVKSNLFFFRRKATAMEENQTPEIIENIFTISYETELQKAVAQQNFRGAIRLHFLQLLTQLSARGFIQYKEGRTNTEYLNQMGSTNQYSKFRRLVSIYEYAWYGQFAVSATTYKSVATDFSEFKNSMAI